MTRAQDRVEFTEGFHGNDWLAIAESLQGDLDRNVVTSPVERWRMRRAIGGMHRKLAAAERLTDRGIALRQAIAAERSARMAWLALLVSVAALALSVWVYIRPLTP